MSINTIAQEIATKHGINHVEVEVALDMYIDEIDMTVCEIDRDDLDEGLARWLTRAWEQGLDTPEIGPKYLAEMF